MEGDVFCNGCYDWLEVRGKKITALETIRGEKLCCFEAIFFLLPPYIAVVFFVLFYKDKVRLKTYDHYMLGIHCFTADKQKLSNE